MIIPGRPMLRLLALTLLPASLLWAIAPQLRDLLSLLPPLLGILLLADLIPLLRRRDNLLLSLSPSLCLVSGRQGEIQVPIGGRDKSGI